jgi:putative methionine-R-sulfoxide reductase with GAF domain
MAANATERIQQYLVRADLDELLDYTAVIEKCLRAFIESLGDLPPAFDDNTLYAYPVPMLSEDGTCSLLEELAPTPYDLTPILGGRNEVNKRKLLLLNQLVEHGTQLTGADWLGIYQARDNGFADRVLVKLAYRGRPSRAEFPLTVLFAQRSTNSGVGLSGKARVIDDVAAFVAEGGGFYVCDDAVQAEICMPLFDEAGRVIGIIDGEASPRAFFNADRAAVVVAMALVAPALLP